MQELGVRPSNFTLSVLAKLCTRGRRPEKAAELCRGLAERYGLQLNVQVYNNLLHACTVMRDMKGAAEVFEKMLREGVRADSRTYSLLIKGYLSSGMVLEAVQRLRSGLGLEGGRQDRKPSGGLVAPDTVSEVLEAVAAQQGTEQAMDLLKEARRVPGLKLDPKLHMRLASSVVGRVGRQWRS
uniref:Pentacotripeptide-repeat region of PRORP domain-containing protein n=1 Tax=Alexandrium andersonii TaxID=327968 RepID=A0A7S2FXJ9_9DINO